MAKSYKADESKHKMDVEVQKETILRPRLYRKVSWTSVRIGRNADARLWSVRRGIISTTTSVRKRVSCARNGIRTRADSSDEMEGEARAASG